MLSREFWRDRRVLITGHTGFKGGWLCLLLHSLGARVTGYALQPPTEPSLFALARIGDLSESHTGDVRDLPDLLRTVGSCKPQTIIHMAAQSVVLASYENPGESYSTNVMGTVNLLDAVRRSGLRCAVVNVTTDKCYENRGWLWGYRETDELGGADPYSSSKACADLVGQCFRRSYFPVAKYQQHGVVIGNARAGNVIGGGDWTDRQLIPSAVAAFASGQPVLLRNPSAVRPWQHVLDCLTGYLRLAEAMTLEGAGASGQWNFGPATTDNMSVADVVEQFARHWAVKMPWVQDPGLHAAEEHTLQLDATKAAQLLRWRCRLTVREAIDWTATWYLGLQAGRDARALCQEQIQRHLEAA